MENIKDKPTFGAAKRILEMPDKEKNPILKTKLENDKRKEKERKALAMELKKKHDEIHERFGEYRQDLDKKCRGAINYYKTKLEKCNYYQEEQEQEIAAEADKQYTVNYKQVEEATPKVVL